MDLGQHRQPNPCQKREATLALGAWITCLSKDKLSYTHRTLGEHGVVLAPREDGGPYGYLTHLVLTVHPWPAGEELPVADEDCLRWVRDRIIL